MTDVVRRRLLQASIAAGVGSLLPSIARAAAIAPSVRSRTLEDLQHVVIFMQENRSFDHYFGSLAGVRGFGDRFVVPAPALPGHPQRTVWLQPSEQGDRVLTPFALDTTGQFDHMRVEGTPHSWPDAQSAFDHFARKKAFAAWEPQVLRDYIEHGTLDATTPQGPRRVLAFDRDVETAIYNTLPRNLDRLLRRHPLQCPVGFLGGHDSQEMKQVGMAMTHKLVGPHPGRLRMLPGSHLFPMERPHETAAAIDACLQALKNPGFSGA